VTIVPVGIDLAKKVLALCSADEADTIAKRRTNHLHPLRDGSEKSEGFLKGSPGRRFALISAAFGRSASLESLAVVPLPLRFPPSIPSRNQPCCGQITCLNYP
jgi:hypothetical protein